MSSRKDMPLSGLVYDVDDVRLSSSGAGPIGAAIGELIVVVNPSGALSTGRSAEKSCC